MSSLYVISCATQTYFISHHLIVLISFLEEISFESLIGKTLEGIGIYFVNIPSLY
jgi:hypothetical protein